MKIIDISRMYAGGGTTYSLYQISTNTVDVVPYNITIENTDYGIGVRNLTSSAITCNVAYSVLYLQGRSPFQIIHGYKAPSQRRCA